MLCMLIADCCSFQAAVVQSWLKKPYQSIPDAAAAAGFKANRSWSLLSAAQVLCLYIKQQRQLELRVRPQSLGKASYYDTNSPSQIPMESTCVLHSLQTDLSEKNLFCLWLEDVDIDPFHKHSVFYLDPNVISVVWTFFWTIRSNTVLEIPQTGYGEDMVWIYNSKSLGCKCHWLKRQNRKYFQGLVFILNNLWRKIPCVKYMFSRATKEVTTLVIWILKFHKAYLDVCWIPDLCPWR